jgi:hypothetical protein
MPVMPRREVAEATISKNQNSQSKKNKASSSPAHTMVPVGYSPQRKHNHSSSKQHLDLKVIDDAFGKHSDLYEDVLQVATSATQEEIQLAYFDRRSELFTLLAKIDSKPQSENMANQRYRAERKMDSVVLAVRILGDPSLRAVYDQVRPERLREPVAAQPTSSARRKVATPRLVTPTSTGGAAGFDDGNSEIYDSSVLEESPSVEVGMDDLPQVSPSSNRSPRRDSRKKKKEGGTLRKLSMKGSKENKKKRHNDSDANGLTKSTSKDTETTEVLSDGDDNVIAPPSTQRKVANLIEDNLSVAMESRQEDDTLAAETMDTLSTTEKEAVQKSTGVFACFSGSRILRKVSDEISGAFEDTLVSVDQVFNAFTLTDKDIKAVTKKIHKAKKQLDN